MTDHATDVTLFERSCAGERAAFGVLIERYRNLVFSVTLGITGDASAAEDLTQDTFVRAWTSLGELREPARFRSWLCVIARNLGINLRRASGRAHADVELTELGDGELDLEGTLERREIAELLARALDTLRPGDREVMLLYYCEACSAKQVAATLGTSVAAVEQRLSRARRRLSRGIEAMLGRELERARPIRRSHATILAALPDRDAVPIAPARMFPRAPLAWATAAMIGVAVMVASPSAKSAIMTAPLGRGAATVIAMLGARPPDAPAAAPQHRAAPRPDVQSAKATAHRSTPPRVTPREGVDYQLTRHSDDTGFSVDLGGGPGPVMFSRGPRERIETREVKGTVTDGEGRPVPGAIVLAGAPHGLHDPEVVAANHAAVADNRGRFVVTVDRGLRTVAFALHRRGFSALQIVADAPDASLPLRLEPPGRVEGVLRRDGDRVDGVIDVVATAPPRGASFRVLAAADGSFSTQWLPPGEYDLAPQATKASWRTRTHVIVRPGEVIVQDLDVPKGAVIEVASRPPKRGTADHYMHILLAGDHAPTSYAEQRKLMFAHHPFGALVRLVAPTRGDDVAIWEDVPPGHYTACATAMSVAEQELGTACAAIDVIDVDRAYTVTLERR